MEKRKISLGAHPFLAPLPALLVASYDASGKANVMIAAWGGVASSDPLCLSVSIRPARWSHSAILERKAFTVGIPTENMAVQADYVGMASGRHTDKALRAGLTLLRAEHVDAPYVAECPVILECTLLQTVDLQAHTMMIGAIVDTRADPSCLNSQGMPDPALYRPLIFDLGTRAYYGIGPKMADAFSSGADLLRRNKGL